MIRVMPYIVTVGLVLICACGQINTIAAAFPGVEEQETSYNDEIAPYVTFLKNGHANPVDYIMGLFERADIVVLGERWHPEITQYDLIYKLVADPRFIEKVGHVFTEIGTSSMNEYVAELMAEDHLGDEEIERSVLHLYRNLGGEGVTWTKTNFFLFLKKLCKLNYSMPANSKIELYLSDMPFSWDEMTSVRYQEFKKELGKRDRVIANQIIKRFRELRNARGRTNKALVIMNYRHAFGPIAFLDGGLGDNVGRYLFEEFPGRVANVMLNTVGTTLGGDDGQEAACAVHDGKWDAAFAVVGNPEVGFDFGRSPFGQDDFDLFPFREHDAVYQDVFTGFVFYKPLSEHKLVFGIPGYLDDGFDEILFKRLDVAGQPVTERDRARYSELEEPSENDYESAQGIEWPRGSLEQQISKWFVSAPRSSRLPEQPEAD